jgi:hypothetical protein
LSTGPRTAEGLARIRQARTTHGRYTPAALEAARAGRADAKEWSRQMMAALREDPQLWHALRRRRRTKL